MTFAPRWRATSVRQPRKPANVLTTPEKFGLEVLHVEKRKRKGHPTAVDVVAIFRNIGSGKFMYGMDTVGQGEAFFAWKMHNLNIINWNEWKNGTVTRWLGWTTEDLREMIKTMREVLKSNGFTEWQNKPPKEYGPTYVGQIEDRFEVEIEREEVAAEERAIAEERAQIRFPTTRTLQQRNRRT